MYTLNFSTFYVNSIFYLNYPNCCLILTFSHHLNFFIGIFNLFLVDLIFICLEFTRHLFELDRIIYHIYINFKVFFFSLTSLFNYRCKRSKLLLMFGRLLVLGYLMFVFFVLVLMWFPLVLDLLFLVSIFI